MPDYYSVSTSRVLDPHQLLIDVRNAISPDVGFSQESGIIKFKKSSAWLPSETTLIDSIIASAQVKTDRSEAIFAVDNYPHEFRALLLAVIDELNMIRSFLGLPQITVQQVINKIKAKI